MRVISTQVSQADDPVLWRSRCWLEQAVIGLNLCPFANAVHSQKRLWLAFSDATNAQTLLMDLRNELNCLQNADPQRIESILLVHPHALHDFAQYNDFLDLADQLLATAELAGVVQIASFHPHYRFADVSVDDVSNNTNRSPFPMLHLLREASVTRAVQSHPDTHEISLTNQRVLTELGEAGWADLRQQWDKL